MFQLGLNVDNEQAWIAVSTLGLGIKSFDDPEKARQFREQRAKQGIPVRIMKVTTTVEEVL